MEHKSDEKRASEAIRTVIGAVYDGVVSPTDDKRTFLAFVIKSVKNCFIGEQAIHMFGVDIEYLVNYLLGHSVLFIKHLPNELSGIVSSYHGAGLCIRVFEKSLAKQLDTISALMAHYKISPPSLKTYGRSSYGSDSYVLFNSVESVKIDGDVNVVIRCQDNLRAQQEHGGSGNSFCEFGVEKCGFFQITRI
jgi:hypothetical protein